MLKISKKLVLILATSALMTEAGKKDEIILKRVFCIYYPLYFQKNIIEVKISINFVCKINASILTYGVEL